MKRWLVPLLLLVVAGMVWASVTPARACTCSELPFDRQVADAQVVVSGHVTGLKVVPAQPEQQRYGHDAQVINAVFEVEQYLKGSGPPTMELWAYGLRVGNFGPSAVCQLFEENSVGRRYVLYLPSGESPGRDPGFCGGSFELNSPDGAHQIKRIRDAVAGLPASGGPEGGAGFPSVQVVPLAVVGPLAFLVGAALLWRRGGG